MGRVTSAPSVVRIPDGNRPCKRPEYRSKLANTWTDDRPRFPWIINHEHALCLREYKLYSREHERVFRVNPTWPDQLFPFPDGGVREFGPRKAPIATRSIFLILREQFLLFSTLQSRPSPCNFRWNRTRGRLCSRLIEIPRDRWISECYSVLNDSELGGWGLNFFFGSHLGRRGHGSSQFEVLMPRMVNVFVHGGEIQYDVSRSLTNSRSLKWGKCTNSHCKLNNLIFL